ncbi:MAG: hypothetical protein WC238_01950 [Parcubacteria group bacterium]|jgi:hypothetical protein
MNKKCENCESDRFEIKARGLCKRCYPLVRKIETINKWRFSKPETLKYYPKESLVYNEKDFKKIKSGFLEQFKDRLVHFKTIEIILNGEIHGKNIIPLFQRISKLSGNRNSDFLWHQEDLFDHNFTPEQNKIIYKILNEIVESISWKGIDWYRIFSEK